MAGCDLCPDSIKDANHVLLNYPFATYCWSHLINYISEHIKPPSILGLVDLLYVTYVEKVNFCAPNMARRCFLLVHVYPNWLDEMERKSIFLRLYGSFEIYTDDG